MKTSETQRCIEESLLEDSAGDQYWQCQLNELEDLIIAKTITIVKTGREATSDLLKEICNSMTTGNKAMLAEVVGLLQDRSNNIEKRLAHIEETDKADLTGGTSRATHFSSSNSEAAGDYCEEDEEAGESEEPFQQNATACTDKEINLFNNYANSNCTNIAANIGVGWREADYFKTANLRTLTHVAAACQAVLFGAFCICSKDNVLQKANLK